MTTWLRWLRWLVLKCRRPGTLSRDDLTLRSQALGLVVKPDRLVWTGQTVRCFEYKSGARQIYPGARIQVAAAMAAVMEHYGVSCDYGWVVGAEGRKFKVENTPQLQEELRLRVERVRKLKTSDLSKPAYVSNPLKSKCNRCGWRDVCQKKRFAK